MSLSAVARGAAFERTVQSWLLHHLSMDLSRSGGANDDGIDLQGWWRLSRTACKIDYRAIVQCKAESKAQGPRVLRELEGTIHRTGASGNVVGVLASASPFTPRSIQRAMSSQTPLLLLHLSLSDTDSPICRALIANRVLQTQVEPCLHISDIRAASPADDGRRSAQVQIRWKNANGVFDATIIQ